MRARRNTVLIKSPILGLLECCLIEKKIDDWIIQVDVHYPKFDNKKYYTVRVAYCEPPRDQQICSLYTLY